MCAFPSIPLSFNVLGQTRSGNPSPTFHTQQRTFNFMMLLCYGCIPSGVYRTCRVLELGTCAVRVHYAIHSPTAATIINGVYPPRPWPPPHPRFPRAVLHAQPSPLWAAVRLGPPQQT